MRTPGAEIGDQGAVFLWVQFGQMDRVTVAQGQRGNQRRAGIGHGAKTGPHLGQAAAIGVIRGEAGLDVRDAGSCLAGFYRLIRAKVVKPAPGMGFDIAERFVLLRQVVQHPGQKRVFLDIGKIARVVKMLIGQHRISLTPKPAGRKRRRPNGG